MYSLDVYQTIHDDRRARHEAAARARRERRPVQPHRPSALRAALVRLRCAMPRGCDGAVPVMRPAVEAP
jgi:hypothetical protein